MKKYGLCVCSRESDWTKEGCIVKSVVIYFSQTGNTQKIAGAIAAGIEQATGQCDSFEIRQIESAGIEGV